MKTGSAAGRKLASLLCAVLLFAPRPAVAQDPEAGLDEPGGSARILVLSNEGIRKATFALGEPFVILGEGFAPREGGTIFLRRQTNELLSEFSTDDDGRFRADVMVTRGLFGGATIIAGSPSAVASIAITIVRPSQATRTIPARDRDVTILGAIAVGLVFAGLGMIFGVRRRRPENRELMEKR